MPVDRIPFPPLYTQEAAPFWLACRERRFVLPHCGACGKFFWPAAIVCPRCLSADVGWRDADTTGTLYSYAVYRRAFHPDLADALPYLVATVALADDVLFRSNLLWEDDRPPAPGQAVALVWRKRQDGLLLPLFQPAGSFAIMESSPGGG